MSSTKRVLSPLKLNNQLVNNKKQKLFSEDYLDCFNDSFDFELEEQDYTANCKESEQLNLTTWQRCVVNQVEREQKTFDLIIHVKNAIEADKEKSGDNEIATSTAKCYLKGPWAHTNISVGDVVSLQATWDTELKAYKIDNSQGFCITNPDMLLSGTTVVGSMFCRRKAVLQNRFHGLDANNKVMVVGSLVHELLQTTLSKGLDTHKKVDDAATELLSSQDTAYMLYGSLLTSQETNLEVQNFVPNIVSFMQRYVKGKATSQPIEADNFQGSIAEIADIEENLWVPQLGLKGKIDVSVHINRSRDNKNSLARSKHAIPLELKTGRATFSMEHKGQLMLYQIMLKAIGRDVSSSGLLLYLREGILREICAGRNEQRDLITLRNELAYYLTRIVTPSALESVGDISESGKLFQPFELPEPISHHSACSNCAYNTICCSFAKSDPKLKLRNEHPLMKLMPEITAQLQLEDLKYFLHWCTLLALEDQDESKIYLQRSLWTETPEKRQTSGRAVLGLSLSGEVKEEENRFVHILKLDNNENDDDVDFTLSGFTVGEYVIVSTKNRLAIAAGFLQNITTTTLTVSLERNLRQNYANQHFIVDKHESQSTQIFNYSNLGVLLEDTERSAFVREIVVHKKSATFVKTLPKVVATKGKEILQDLNSLQRSAVLKALTTENFMLIKGLPGTGKTQTLVAIVRLLQILGKTVIITSHTHSAVDNLLLRLKSYKLNMLRLGNASRINPALHYCAESVVMKDCRTEKELSEKYAAFSIVGVTCLAAAHSIFLHRKFDYCIVDEATQVMQPTVLRPLYFSSRFILVGDPDQLPPLIRSREARKGGAAVSLFERLDNEAATSVLSLQYRMNRTITKLANELTYDGALKCGSNAVEMATLTLESKTVACTFDKWLQRALQTHIDQSVFLLDTMDCFTRSFEFVTTKHKRTSDAIEKTFGEETLPNSPQKSQQAKKRISKYTNYCDAAIIFQILKVLLTAGYDAERIGIIAPYRAQVELLKKLMLQIHAHFERKQEKLNFGAIEVNTVDQYQGRDKDLIIYSGSKTGSSRTQDMERLRESEILEDKRRLTVAITRAKHKLILVADAACLEQYTPFKTLFTRIPSFCKLRLEDNKLNFEWQKLFNELEEIIS